jgi:hypothetical protein
VSRFCVTHVVDALLGTTTGDMATKLKQAMADGNIESVLHEMDSAPKERTSAGSGGGSVSHRFLCSLEGAALAQQTDGKGLPIRLEEILERRRERVRNVKL